MQQINNYEQLIYFLENNLKRSQAKIGFEAIQAVAGEWNNPHTNYHIIRVAGTNGKGSTANYIAKLLESQNLKVGLFTSPHLISYCERIKINQKPISSKSFCEITNQINQKLIPKIELTTFEFITLVSMIYFAKEKCDVVIYEAGLGAKYDATAITNPMISILTNISLDHAKFFNNNLDQIAFEKSAVFTKNAFNLLGEKNIENEQLILKYCKDLEVTKVSKILQYQVNEKGFEISFDFLNNQIVNQFNMYGIHQIDNLKLAIQATEIYCKKVNLKVDLSQIVATIPKLNHNGRFQRLQSNVWYDGAHNIDGIKKLIETLKVHFNNQKFTVFFIAIQEKEHLKMQQELVNSQLFINFYQLQIPHYLNVREVSNIPQINYKEALKVIANNPNNQFIVCGSFYGYQYFSKLCDKL